MADPQRIPLTPPSLPAGYCWPATPQQFLIDAFTGAFGTLAASVGTGFNYGSAIPGVDDTNKPWVRLNPDNSDAGTWTFAFGKWTMLYPTPAGPNDFRSIWVGTLADLYSYDGGDGVDPTVTPPTQVTGSFWEQDPQFAARTIVGVGTLPISLKVLAVGDLGGLEKVSLDISEMPPHTHQSQQPDQAGSPNNVIWGTSPGGAGAAGAIYPSEGGLGGPNSNPMRTTLKDTGGDLTVTPVVVKPHENMPPYVAVYVIKRTGRTHYAI